MYVEIPTLATPEEKKQLYRTLRFVHLLPRIQIVLDENTLDYSAHQVQYVCKWLQALAVGAGDAAPLLLQVYHLSAMVFF